MQPIENRQDLESAEATLRAAEELQAELDAANEEMFNEQGAAVKGMEQTLSELDAKDDVEVATVKQEANDESEIERIRKNMGNI